MWKPLLIGVLGMTVLIAFLYLARGIGATHRIKQYKAPPSMSSSQRNCRRICQNKFKTTAAPTTQTGQTSSTDCLPIQEMAGKGSTRANTLSALIGLMCGALGTIIVMVAITMIKARMEASRRTNLEGQDNPSTEAEGVHPERNDDAIDPLEPFSERPSRKYYEILDIQTTQIHCETDYATIRSQRQLVSRRTNSGYEIPLTRASQALPGVISDPTDENSYLETPASVPRYQNWNAESRNARSTLGS